MDQDPTKAEAVGDTGGGGGMAAAGAWLRAAWMYLVMQVGLAHLKLGHAHAAGPAHLALPYTLHRYPERATTA